jgi:predicted secreted Zn-dependent protease
MFGFKSEYVSLALYRRLCLPTAFAAALAFFLWFTATSAAEGAKPTIYKVNNATITFQGKTLAEVVEEISQRPEKEAGSMLCKPYLRRSGSDGKVTSCQLTVTCTMTLPAWSNRHKRSASARAEWDRFAAATRQHEQGHLDVMKPYYDGVCKAAIGKSRAQSEQLAHDAHKEAVKASREYDVRTDHGQKTGTVIDISKDD